MDTTANTATTLSGDNYLPPITGKTRIFGILADPVDHVKTPEVMNTLFRTRGVDAVLIPFHVEPEGLAGLVDCLRHMKNFGGFIATMPHKTIMPDLCDVVSDAARHVGAVNCVRREPDGKMVGTILDGIGFIGALRAKGINPDGMTVYLAGAGGAASAIAFALADAGVRHITVANRNTERATALTSRLRAVYPALSTDIDVDAVGKHDLVVNGTSLGMAAEDAPPLDFSKLRTDQLVADAIMVPLMTPMLVAAQAKRCRIFPGKPMLEAQIVLMAEHMGAFS